ncbi:helix-turn-helix transcriptional regulator [Alkalibacterium sp. f15]
MEVSRQAVLKWETGKSEPSTNNLKKLAELFSCSVNDLLSSDKRIKDY